MNREFWTRKYKFKLNEELAAVFHAMQPYIVTMLIWYIAFPMVINTFGRIIHLPSLGWSFMQAQTYFFNIGFWLVMGYAYQSDVERGSNYFLLVSFLIYIFCKMILFMIFGSGDLVYDVLNVVENQLPMIILYLICEKFGMILA